MREGNVRHSRGPAIRGTPAAFVATAVLLLAATGCQPKTDGLTFSGRVEQDRSHVGSRIGGRVWRLNAEEGGMVKAGAAIVELERNELDARMREARAAAKQAEAQLNLLRAGTRPENISRAEAVLAARKAELELRHQGFRKEEVRGAEARLASAKSSCALAERELRRAEELAASEVVAQQALDAKRAELETAQAAVEVAEQHLQLVRSGSRPEEVAMAEARVREAEAELQGLRNGPRKEELEAAEAALEAAEANVSRIQTQLDETRIRAPVDARIETLDLQPGDLVQPGQAVVVLTLAAAPWVRCYVPENRLGLVRPGQHVSVMVDSFPGVSFPGVISRLDHEAEFTPRNVQTREKRVDLVFEMKVQIMGAADGLRAGMYADVSVDAETAR